MSATSTAPSTARRRLPAPDAVTTAGAVLALGCTFVGQYVETPWKADSQGWGFEFSANGGWAALAVVVAFIAVALLLVGFATDRARAVPPERTAVGAVVLAGLGVLAIVVFYLGIPSVLAAGAAGLALDARRRLGRFSAAGAIALTLAALTLAGAVYLAFAG